MDPEEDFLTWSVILQSSFESGEYTSLLPSFIGLVNDITTTSKLHGILEENTDYFLNTVLPDTIRSVLSLGYLSAAERDACTTFLISVLPLISWSAVHDKFTLTQTLMQILDVKANIYTKNSTYRACLPYEEVAKSYTNEDMNTELFNFIKENCPEKSIKTESSENDNNNKDNEKETEIQNTENLQPDNTLPENNNNKLSIYHFDVLFYGYCLIEESDFVKIEDISNIVEITPYFIRFINTFQSDDRLRELDTSLLSRAFQSLIIVLLENSSKPYEAHVFEPLFEIANNFVQSEMLEKQLVGASILSKAAESRDSKVKKVFQEWASTTTLADFLASKDIHAKLLEELDPVLSKIITPKHLDLFWEKAQQAHSLERSTMLSIIASTLKKFDEDVTVTFIDRITSADSIPSDLLEFLANVAKSLTSVNVTLSLHIIDTLIDYGEKLPDNANPNGSVTALAIFAPYNSNTQCQQRIINLCSNRLISNPSKQKFYIQVLTNMIAQTYPSRNDFNSEFLTSLINVISNPNFDQYQNRPELFDLLTLLFTKKKYKLDIDMFDTLISFRIDDLLWNFLNEIIVKLGIDAFDSDVREKIKITAKQVDFRNNSSLTFVQFLTQFILIWNYKTGNVKSEYMSYYQTKTLPNNYVIAIFPPERTGLLFKVIIFTRDDYVASDAASKILFFIEKTKNSTPRKIINTLIDYFSKITTLIEKQKQIKNTKETKGETCETQKEEENSEAKKEENQSETCETQKEENKEEDKKDENNKETCEVKNDENDEVIDADTENAEYIAKTRILKLILQYIDGEEKDSYIEDYGVSRHKERSEVLKKRRSTSDEIKLHIIFGSQNFVLKTSRHSTPDDLKKRISQRFECSNLSLYHNGTPLSAYNTLYLASVKDGSTIVCQQYQTHDPKPGKKMPTMILYEKDFSKPMLEILSKSSPINETDECITSLNNLQKIVSTILKRLPSDKQIVEELDNMDIFIKNLSNSISNTRLFLYRIQILLTGIENKEEISSSFISHGGAKLLSDYLLSHEAPFHGLTLILKTLIIIFKNKLIISTEINADINEKLIFYVMNLFDLVEKRSEIKKSLISAVNFLVDFLKNDKKQASDIIYKHTDLLEKMIDNIDISDRDSYYPFRDFIEYLDNKVQLFHLCVSMLNKNISQGSTDSNVSIDQNTIYIIRSTIPYVHNLEDIRIVLDNCWKVMSKYLSTLNVINHSMNPILPVPQGYEDETYIKDNINLTYASRSQENQASQLSGICQIIYSILTQEYELRKEETKDTSHILDLLKLTFSTGDEKVQNELFELLGLLIPSPDDKEHYEIVIQNLRDAINEICTDRWNYKPSTFAKSPTGFTGLRNLGSTCYMNSIFQQLFFTFPFTYLIILSDMKSPLPAPNNQKDGNAKKVEQNEGNQKLKELFTQLLLTRRRCCDTQPFCSSWKGWGKRLINPREQQDANEFLQLLLDQLPTQLNSPFKGEFKNVIEGVSEDFYSFNIEQFYTICLEIKGYKDVMASFEFFIKDEPLMGESQYSISQDHKIDAKKYEMIKTAPDVLVLQLKRFEYNLTTFERIKVNDRYEFPNELNISKFMVPESSGSNTIKSASNSREIDNNENNNNDADNDNDINDQSLSTNIESGNSNKYNYVLAGVVVHSGNAEGGHYYSIIKIDNCWIKFNDIEVTEITQEEFEEETFGGQSTNKTNSAYNDAFEDSTGASAYLLFYRRVNAVYETDLPVSLFKQCQERESISDDAKPSADDDKTVHVKLRYDKPFDLTYLCDTEIIKSIEEDNKELVNLQSIFSKKMYDFIMNSNKIEDLETLVSYFFHIYCHSSFSQEATLIQYSLNKVIKTEEQWNYCIEYIQTNFKKLIEPILINCSISEIMECSTEFITRIIANVSPEKSYPFVEELLRTLVYVLNASWRQVPHVSELMKNFVTQGENHASLALANNWITKFLDFIMLVYDPTQHNELLLLLSPTATPTSSTSSTLAYASSNSSSGNLVQQITRSTVILQNINLTNVFLILSTLFDSCPSKEYERIVKYSSSILQSPAHSSHYINLLKKMSEANVIDINVLINAITTNKKEIDNDLVFEVILNILLATEDQERIEYLISKVCPHVNASLTPTSSSSSVYGMNAASLSLTTAFAKRILNIVKQKNQQVINFLLANPAQTIFRFLIDNDKQAREYGEKIVMNIYKKVSKVSDKDRQKIIMKNSNIEYIDDNKSDSNDDRITYNAIEELKPKNERKDELTDEDKESMNQFYCSMLQYIFDFDEVDISQYYEKENESYSNSQDSYHFINFLNVFEWLIIRLNILSDESFSAVEMLFHSFSEMKNKVDHNMITCLRIINLFNVETQQNVFEENYNSIFVKWNKIQGYETIQLFSLFSNFLVNHCRPYDALVVFKHPAMKKIYKELLNASSPNDLIAFSTINKMITNFIDNDDHTFIKDGQKVEEEFSLKQVIFMETKNLFANGDLSGITALWTHHYTELIEQCYKYMSLQTRKNLMKELAKTLNLPRKQSAYSNYYYETNNSKKFIEACKILLTVFSKPELLPHQVIQVQKDRYYDLITSKRNTDEPEIPNIYEIDSNNDNDPYEDDHYKTVTNNNDAYGYDIYNPSYAINQGINYDELNSYDEEPSPLGSSFSVKIIENDDNNENNCYEKLFIKWEKFVDNYLSVDEEKFLFKCARVFSLISKDEMKGLINKLNKLKTHTQTLRNQIERQKEAIRNYKLQKQQNNQTEEEEEEEEDQIELRNSLILNKLTNQLKSKERDFLGVNDEDTLTIKMFEELTKLLNKNSYSSEASKIAILMTDLIFIIMDYRLVREKIVEPEKLNDERMINIKAVHLVKLNNLIQAKRSQSLSHYFSEALFGHFEEAHQHPERTINEDLDDFDNWSFLFVRETICNFAYNRFSLSLYSQVITDMDDREVVRIFKKFCENTKFSESLYSQSDNFQNNYYDDDSDDDYYIQNQNQFHQSSETCPIEESFNKAAIFFNYKPNLRKVFQKIFPLKFSQITYQENFANKDYIKAVYGTNPPGFDDEQVDTNISYDYDDEDEDNNNNSDHFVDNNDNDNINDNSRSIDSNNDHIANNNDSLDNIDQFEKANDFDHTAMEMIDTSSDQYMNLPSPSSSIDIDQNQNDQKPDYNNIANNYNDNNNNITNNDNADDEDDIDDNWGNNKNEPKDRGFYW